jgi:hypothetical protein
MTIMKNIALLCVLTMIAFSAMSQVPAGDRVIGMQIDESELEDYESALERAKSMCASVVHLSFSWGAMEPVPTEIGGDLISLLEVVDFYYPSHNLAVELNIPVYNTVVKDVPSDLADIAFDDPIMIERFNILLDSVFAQFGEVELLALNIGNESDVIMGIDETKIQEFKTFFTAVKQHANDLHSDLYASDLKIGTTLTYEAFDNEWMWPLYESLNEAADIVSVTYYGMTDDFQVKEPIEVVDDLGVLATRYPVDSKMIYVVELGYPTSSVNGSSESKQAEFFEHAFSAWDAYIDQIAMLSIFKLADWSQEEVDYYGEFYGLPGVEGFTEFLRTLGLRTYEGEGEDKIAVEVIKCAAGIRDFCVSGCATDILEVEKNEKFKAYPNPSSGVIHIQGDATLYSKIVVRTMMGAVLEEFGSTDKLDLRHIPAGMYILQFSKDNNPSAESLLITLQ